MPCKFTPVHVGPTLKITIELSMSHVNGNIYYPAILIIVTTSYNNVILWLSRLQFAIVSLTLIIA